MLAISAGQPVIMGSVSLLVKQGIHWFPSSVDIIIQSASAVKPISWLKGKCGIASVTY
jgi:hypothetical protein